MFFLPNFQDIGLMQVKISEKIPYKAPVIHIKYFFYKECNLIWFKEEYKVINYYFLFNLNFLLYIIIYS